MQKHLECCSFKKCCQWIQFCRYLIKDNVQCRRMADNSQTQSESQHISHERPWLMFQFLKQKPQQIEQYNDTYTRAYYIHSFNHTRTRTSKTDNVCTSTCHFKYRTIIQLNDMWQHFEASVLKWKILRTYNDEFFG